MARSTLEASYQLANSPFAPLPQRYSGRHYKPPYMPVARCFAHNLRMHEAIIQHLDQLAASKKCREAQSSYELILLVSGFVVQPSLAWEWLLDNFEASHPGFFDDQLMREAMAFGRGRISVMRQNEAQDAKARRNSQLTKYRTQVHAIEKAENGGDVVFFHSASWRRLRYEVLAESDGRCSLCGRSSTDHGVALEVDHIKPRSRFPNLSLEKPNLQVLCFDCNRGKGNRDTRDWRDRKTGACDTDLPS